MAIDQRTKKLAKTIVDYSLEIKKGENVVISGSTENIDFARALYEESILRGAYPHLHLSIPGTAFFFFKNASDEQLNRFPKILDYTVKNTQKYISIDSDYNTKELAQIDPQKLAQREKTTRKISNYIVNRHDKIWRCNVGYPCAALAQDAEMSTSEYENFVFSACNLNWKKLNKDINRLLKYFKKGKIIELIGKNTNLKFAINGELAASCTGKENMPGGEIFMAPVRTSMEGHIKFDFPAIETGKEVSDIYLEFKKGKVIKASASKNEDFLKEMLKIDKNASYVGEFGIGCNPKIKKFSRNLLFDEKISGTIHLALGMAYKENGGGNDSAIHWDIVKDIHQGKIILDNKIVQENGKWKI